MTSDPTAYAPQHFFQYGHFRGTKRYPFGRCLFILQAPQHFASFVEPKPRNPCSQRGGARRSGRGSPRSRPSRRCGCASRGSAKQSSSNPSESRLMLSTPGVSDFDTKSRKSGHTTADRRFTERMESKRGRADSGPGFEDNPRYNPSS